MKTHERPYRVLLILVLAVMGGFGCGCGEDEQQASCTDGVLNGDETDVDCGGSCGGCLDGKVCALDDDCLSGFCRDKVCATPSCDDGIKNAQETDVDCGGPLCPPCGVGSSCLDDLDCRSGACEEGVCDSADTCADGVFNGDETDVDCGGSCEPCSIGQACSTGADCVSGNCGEQGLCIPAPTCDDDILNGDETDVDCGGSECPPCREHHTCNVDTDCMMGVCAGGICDAGDTEHCDNGVMDGDESDIDCGGSCPPCQIGFSCEHDEDCESISFVFITCMDGVCGGVATCADDERNGHESDVDCGGPHCHPCGAGAKCGGDDDCASGLCDEGTCTEPEYTCDTGVMDGHETDVDCGGPVCPPCERGFRCLVPTDCESRSCLEGVCDGLLSCKDGVMNGHETDVDCGGPVCSPCEVDQSCLVNTDCRTGICNGGICQYAATCGDGEQNDQETDLDCGGPSCLPCEVGKSCLEHSDCVTDSCFEGACVYSIPYLQSSDASLDCVVSGRVTIMEDVTTAPVVVQTGAFSIDEGTVGYYISDGTTLWRELPYSGILVAVDSSLGLSFERGDVVRVTGDYVEDDCMSTLAVTSAQGMSVLSGYHLTPPSSVRIDQSAVENGGTAEAEPYEGVLVDVRPTEVVDIIGHDGPEEPGRPNWWFKLENDIYVANDFGLTNLPEVGTTVVVEGLLKHSRGVYLLVPPTESSIQ